MPQKIACFVAGLVLAAASSYAQNATEAGRFVVEHPTLLNLGFEWSIRGDANRNASVDVEFRAAGDSTWRKALPLVRIGGEKVYRTREHLDYVVPDGFAGSILNLLRWVSPRVVKENFAPPHEVGYPFMQAE